MKKLIAMLFTMTIVISLTAQNNGFNFNKTNNYSKTYTYNSKTTIFYRVIEVVDWECIKSGKSIKECTSLVRRYQMKENEVMIEDKETIEMFEMMIEDKETID